MDTALDPLRLARHQVKGCLHGMKLCLAALETDDLPQQEAEEFLSHIENAADKLPGLLDEYEAEASRPA